MKWFAVAADRLLTSESWTFLQLENNLTGMICGRAEVLVILVILVIKDQFRFSYLWVIIKSIPSFCGLVPSLEYSANTLSFRLDCILSYLTGSRRDYTGTTGTKNRVRYGTYILPPYRIRIFAAIGSKKRRVGAVAIKPAGEWRRRRS